jgi:hypothetical protein
MLRIRNDGEIENHTSIEGSISDVAQHEARHMFFRTSIADQFEALVHFDVTTMANSAFQRLEVLEEDQINIASAEN